MSSESVVPLSKGLTDDGDKLERLLLAMRCTFGRSFRKVCIGVGPAIDFNSKIRNINVVTILGGIDVCYVNKSVQT